MPFVDNKTFLCVSSAWKIYNIKIVLIHSETFGTPFLTATLCHRLSIHDNWVFHSSEGSYLGVFTYDLFNDALSSIG